MTEHQPATYTLTEQQLLDVYTAGLAAGITHLMVRQTGAAPLEATKRVVAGYLTDRERLPDRLPHVDDLAAQLTAALADHPHDPRTLVLAMRLMLAASGERQHLAEQLQIRRRAAAATTAGQARAAAASLTS